MSSIQFSNQFKISQRKYSLHVRTFVVFGILLYQHKTTHVLCGIFFLKVVNALGICKTSQEYSKWTWEIIQ